MQDKKQNSSFLLVLVLVAVAVGFAAAAIVFRTKGNNQIITQTDSRTPSGDIEGMLPCFDKPEDERQKCLDDFMVEYFKGRTTKQVLSDIEIARTKNSRIENDCHPIVHAVGRETYKQEGNIGDSFEACDQTCHSGCYHGVMERLFYSDTELTANYRHLTFEDMKDKIPGICDADKFNDPSTAVIFQCLHGVGHAILYSLDYNFDDSLASCDLFETQYQRSSCYGGVIMENVTAFDKKKRDLKADEPLYPCSRLDDKYKADCYQMQTSVMLEYGLTMEEIVKECEKTGDYQLQCFTSMGRDLSNYVRTGYTDYVVDSCENIAGTHWENCVSGAIFALIDNTWDMSFASQLCNALKDQEHAEQCFMNAIHYYKGSYTKTDSDAADQCRSYGERNRDFCLSQISF